MMVFMVSLSNHDRSIPCYQEVEMNITIRPLARRLALAEPLRAEKLIYNQL
jgi:hypothetical protein